MMHRRVRLDCKLWSGEIADGVRRQTREVGPVDANDRRKKVTRMRSGHLIGASQISWAINPNNRCLF